MLCLFVYNHHLSAWLREVITQTPTFTINLRESVASNLLYQSVFIILQQLCFSIHFMHSYMSSPLFFAAGCPSSAEPPVTADHVHFAHWTGDNQDILATRSVPSVTTLLRINSDLPLPLFRLLLLSTKLAVYLGVPQEKKRTANTSARSVFLILFLFFCLVCLLSHFLLLLSRSDFPSCSSALLTFVREKRASHCCSCFCCRSALNSTDSHGTDYWSISIHSSLCSPPFFTLRSVWADDQLVNRHQLALLPHVC